MKIDFVKIGLTILFVLGMFISQAQSISVNGTVTDIDTGFPIQNQLVVVSVTDNGFLEDYEFYTNDAGFYGSDTIPAGDQGTLRAFTIDCWGIEIFEEDYYNPSNTSFNFDFEICTDTIQGGDCENFFWFDTQDYLTFEFFGEAFPQPANDYFWDFGDGTTANGQNVIHTFDPGVGDIVYVSLTTQTYSPGNDTCIASSIQEIWIGNIPDCENWFWYESVDNFTFDFFGEAFPLPANEYLWDFGDGATGTGQFVSHTYDSTGVNSYLVTLNTMTYDPVNGDTCYASHSELVWIGIQNDCEAGYSYTQDSIDQLTYHFEDLSIGAISYWFWDFGDGSFSEEQNPEYTFSSPGSYLVCLTIFSDSLGFYCEDTYCAEIIVDYILVSSFNSVLDTLSGIPNFYSFVDMSFGEPDFWYWDFGDGNFSDAQFPTHQYEDSGDYEVCLEVTRNFPGGPTNSDVYCQTIHTPSYYDFGGMTFLGDHPMNNINGDTTVVDTGIVYIYRKYPDMIVPVDTSLFYQYGFYWFIDIMEGDYIVKIGLTENSLHYGDYLSAYHESALFWDDANVLNLYDTNYFVNVNLEEIVGIDSGPGSIYGSLEINGNCPVSSDIEGVEIILLNENNIPLTFTTSGFNGEYEFENLPLGTYKLYAEATGLSTTAEVVSFSETNLQINDLTLELSCDQSIGVEEYPLENILAGEVYPNPVYDNVNIDIKSSKFESLTICIFDIQGRKILEKKYDLPSGEQNLIINCNDFPGGLYLLSISSDQGTRPIIRKFIK